MKLPQSVVIALELLNSNNFEAFVVGGCVRDAIMGNNENDYDVTTSALPHETMSVFKDYKVIETGIKHGTVTVIINHFHIEITTYRIDGEYTNNRHPDNVSFTRDLSGDLSRRDFTMNALCYHPKLGFIDYFNGISDIQNRIIRTVGNANERFNQDALRILRALRFSAVLGFNIEDNTALAIHQNKHLLNNISVERIASELNKIICSNSVKGIFTNFYDVFSVFIPEIIPMVGFKQNNKYHVFDVFTHTLVATEHIKGDAHLRLAMLLHDIGKPHSYSEGDDGIGHFYAHAKASCTLAREILNRLKYDNFTKDRVLTLIKYHDIQINPTHSSIKKLLAKLGSDVFFEILEIKRADCIAQNPDYIHRLVDIDTIFSIAHEIINAKECFLLKSLAINGSDLISIDIPAGKDIGVILKKLLELVISDNTLNTRDILLGIAKDIYTNK